jgi:hypothetical protein
LRSQHQAKVLQTAFDAAHVRAVNARSMGQFFLRQLGSFPSGLDGQTERNQLWCESVTWRAARHPRMVLS